MQLAGDPLPLGEDRALPFALAHPGAGHGDRGDVGEGPQVLPIALLEGDRRGTAYPDLAERSARAVHLDLHALLELRGGVQGAGARVPEIVELVGPLRVGHDADSVPRGGRPRRRRVELDRSGRGGVQADGRVVARRQVAAVPCHVGEDVRERVLVGDSKQHVVEGVALPLPSLQVRDDLGRLGLGAGDEVEHDEREADDGDDGQRRKDDVRAVVGEVLLEDEEADQLDRNDEEHGQDDAGNPQAAEGHRPRAGPGLLSPYATGSCRSRTF